MGAFAGLAVGHHTDPRRPTGCTVVLCGDAGAVCGVDVRGGAPGTRETALLDPTCTVQRVHAVLLAGGSAFGLDAATGVVRWLETRGIGVRIGPTLPDGRPAVVPIVPAAIVFDLWIGNPSVRPDADAGFAACEAAHDGPIAEGNVGAGAGASVGKLFGIERATRGGLGVETLEANGVTVAALVVVNALGDVVNPETGAIVAGARDDAGTGWLDQSARLRAGAWPPARGPVVGPGADGDHRSPVPSETAGTATTIAVVATDAVLDKAEATKVAQMAHDGLARAIRPLHTPGDGDTVFALATGASGRRAPTGIVGALAADALERAVLRGVRAATAHAGADGRRIPAGADVVPATTRSP